jgi:hypothetical protein
MVDCNLRDGYNRAITRRRIVISSFVKNKTVGNFNVSARPTGRLRSKPLIQSSVPYFTGSAIRMKLIIKKVMEGGAELPFEAEVYQIEPKPITNELYRPIIINLYDKCTPFEGKYLSYTLKVLKGRGVA